jgi:SAM-dependent methyltransferase
MRWDAQQTRYLPDRESRFAIMLDAVEAVAGSEFRALDLACGPGAIAQRICARFPAATVQAVDLDPVLLELGKRAVGGAGGRIKWAEADLNSEDWDSRLDEGAFDAILTTTALHWLPLESLALTYRKAHGLLRPGGILLNGDHMRFEASQAGHRDVVQAMREQRQARHAASDADDWSGWWGSLRLEPGLEDLFAERERRFGWRQAHDEESITFETHRRLLLEAGFASVDSIWQTLDNRVLAAIR